MSALLEKHTALTTPTRFAEVNGRTLAYRLIGSGPPLILCVRLRGVLDVWDPAFLDALARHFTVVTFDYSGLGRSTGRASYDRKALARDAKDLADALGFDKVVIGGWSLGGMAAQVFATLFPERTSHAILIGTTPPGPQPHGPEPLFFQTALKFENTLEDEYILFFEPASPASRAAGKASHERIAARTADRSPVVPEAVFLKLLAETRNPDALFADDAGYADFLAAGPFPILALNGDHDIVFPVENWYALNRKWKSLHVATFPQSGHGPQHQYPAHSAELIASFVRATA